MSLFTNEPQSFFDCRQTLIHHLDTISFPTVCYEHEKLPGLANPPQNGVQLAKRPYTVPKSIRTRRALLDWKTHKEYCRKVKAAGDNTFDAILFPATESKPCLVKVPYQLIRATDEYEEDLHKPDLSLWFKHPRSAIKPYYFDQLGFEGPAIGHALSIFFDDNFDMNNLPLKRSIVDVTKNRAGYTWRGNVVGIRMKNVGQFNFLDNVVMDEDLELFAKYFENYGRY